MCFGLFWCVFFFTYLKQVPVPGQQDQGDQQASRGPGNPQERPSHGTIESQDLFELTTEVELFQLPTRHPCVIVKSRARTASAPNFRPPRESSVTDPWHEITFCFQRRRPSRQQTYSSIFPCQNTPAVMCEKRCPPSPTHKHTRGLSDKSVQPIASEKRTEGGRSREEAGTRGATGVNTRRGATRGLFVQSKSVEHSKKAKYEGQSKVVI